MTGIYNSEFLSEEQIDEIIKESILGTLVVDNPQSLKYTIMKAKTLIKMLEDKELINAYIRSGCKDEKIKALIDARGIKFVNPLI
jgi:hypothetical protein